MFTGLVQHVGSIASVQPSGQAAVRLLVDAPGWDHVPQVGDSISVSGVCLTVAEAPEGGRLAFDAVPETLDRTTLGGLRPGSRVNLEHSATASTLLGGHIVQGHVEGIARVIHVQRGDDWRIRLSPPGDLMPYLVPKGSVCLEGVSLTIAALDPEAGWFEVALIPQTLGATTLGELAAGDACNVETDCLARMVVHYLRHYAGPLAPPDSSDVRPDG